MLIIFSGDRTEGWRHYIKDLYPDNSYVNAESLPAMTRLTQRRLQSQHPIIILTAYEAVNYNAETVERSLAPLLKMGFPLIVINVDKEVVIPNELLLSAHGVIFNDFYTGLNYISDTYFRVSEPIAVVQGAPLI